MVVALSEIIPEEVKETVLVPPPVTLPLRVKLPTVLLIETAPVPVCETPVTVKPEALLLLKVRAPPPVLVPLKLAILFALDKVVPPTEVVVSEPALSAAFWVMVPTEFKVKLFVIEDAPMSNAMLSFNVALLPVKLTAPAKLLVVPFVLKSIALAPALKLDVPVTLNAAF